MQSSLLIFIYSVCHVWLLLCYQLVDLCHNIDIVMNMCCMQNYMKWFSLAFIFNLLFAMLMQMCSFSCRQLWSGHAHVCEDQTGLKELLFYQTALIFRINNSRVQKQSLVESLRASEAAALVLSLSDTCYMNSVCLRGTNESQKHQIEAVTDGQELLYKIYQVLTVFKSGKAINNEKRKWRIL